MKLTRKQWMMLVVLVLGAFVTVLNQTLVTPALPSIMTEMNVDQSTAQWLTTGFTLVSFTPSRRHQSSMTDTSASCTLPTFSVLVRAMGVSRAPSSSTWIKPWLLPKPFHTKAAAVSFSVKGLAGAAGSP